MLLLVFFFSSYILSLSYRAVGERKSSMAVLSYLLVLNTNIGRAVYLLLWFLNPYREKKKKIKLVLLLTPYHLMDFLLYP